MSIRRPLFVAATLIAASVALPALANELPTGGIAVTSPSALQSLGSSQPGGFVGQPGMGGMGQTPFGHPGFAPSLPSVTNNSLTGTNVAAGTGNGAFQGIGATQKGGSGGQPGFVSPLTGGMGLGGIGGSGFAPSVPPVTTNTTVGTNVAAGIGNGAFQNIGTSQAGAGLGFTNNSVNGLNLAAGEFNLANQQIGGNQH